MTLKERLGLKDDPLFLMDGSAFIYRAFFANRNMRRSDGFPTNALVVVTRILLRILRDEHPTHFCFIRDGRGRTFRHEIFPLYKANRDAMPEDLARQIEPVTRMVRALGLRYEETEGYEADDAIASLAARFSGRMPVVIVSGDKDLKQCLGPNVFMWDPAAKEEKLLDAEAFEAESGVAPSAWPDVQALVGDASDNIPGVPGIGPKTAMQIFALCPGLEEIRDHLDRLPPKLQTKLKEHVEAMFTWRRLTRLSRDFCKDVTLDDMAVRPPDAAKCRALTDEFELVAIRRDMAALMTPDTGRGGLLEALSPAHGAEAGGVRVLTQASLFTPVPRQDVAEASRIEDLPDCTGRTVAFIWPRGDRAPAQCAVEGVAGEYRWLGDNAPLAEWFARAGRCVVADLKTLLRASSCWRRLFTPDEEGGAGAGGAKACFDLGIAAWLLSPEEDDYGWPRLSTHWAAALAAGASGPAGVALALARRLESGLEEAGLLDLYEKLEMPLVPVLARMESFGVAIDAAAFRSFLDDVQGRLDALTASVYARTGRQFNIRSAQQLGEVLFDGLGLPAPRKTKGGQASTSQETLEKLSGSHPVVDDILEFRKLEKMRSTYLAPLPRLVDAKGRIHTTFNQKGTATGRLSSLDPNLQNIPVRGGLGKRMRACFVAREGCSLVSADYSQVELRVLAHLSQDASLLEAFRKGADIHAHTASLIYDLPQEEITADQRRSAKTINFGLIYGMGAQKLGRELKLSLAEAKSFIERYFSRLTGLKAFYEKVEADARERGFVTTMAGRRRLLPDINSSNGQASALARRQAVNTVIQGSAADIIKLAMLAVAADDMLRRMDARVLLQVHDELLLEVPEDAAAEAGERAARLMEGVCPGGEPLSLPLVVDWGAGSNWGEAH